MKLKIVILIFILAGLGKTLHAGQKVDTIYYQHGDRLTGEAKEMSFNQLKLKTDDSGNIVIEWNTIDSVVILNTMRIVMDDGEIMYGQIHPGAEDGMGTILTIVGSPLLVYLVRIVSLTPVEKRFVDRLSGLFSSGFSYVKSTEILQVNLNASLDYEAEKNHVGIFYNGHVSEDPAVTNQRQSSGLTFRRYLPQKWFLVIQLSAETNSAQGLDLRTGFEFSGGNSVIYSNRTRLDLTLGLQANRENSSSQNANNIESIIAGNYSIFIFDNPEISFGLDANLIPSLNDPGRIRSEIDSNLKWEVFKDFYLKWTFYYSFDNRPLDTEASKSDWAINMLGIEYKL